MKHSAVLLALASAATAADCPNYEQYARQRHEPYSTGKYKLPSQRPAQECRTYSVPEVESTIKSMKKTIKDPDLYQLFQNTWPNTVDTTVLWTGKAADDPDEELAFINTGDINAMWLRDSANQLQSYKPILKSKTGQDAKANIAALYRGTINLQGRYIQKYPYCNAFQPPAESKIPPVNHRKRSTIRRDTVNPPYDPNEVWECKYELDSVSAFLQLSWDYYDATHDDKFFSKFQWSKAIRSIMDMAKGMMEGTYAEDGSVNKSPYTWARDANTASEVVTNKGAGNPIQGHIGLVRSFFRPSDDSTIYQYFIPANMMFARNLKTCAIIMAQVGDAKLAREMEAMASGIYKAIDEYAIINHPKFGKIYAYEVDGLGSFNLMDDANVPSLLSIPHLGYENSSALSDTYKNTRKYVFSTSNPYYAHGPVINSIGGPHQGPGMVWPMALIMRIMTSNDDMEIIDALGNLLRSTDGLGLIHESIDTHNVHNWTRSWFAWVNGLFGQMLLDLAERKPHILSRSFQR